MNKSSINDLTAWLAKSTPIPGRPPSWESLNQCLATSKTRGRREECIRFPPALVQSMARQLPRTEVRPLRLKKSWRIPPAHWQGASIRRHVLAKLGEHILASVLGQSEKNSSGKESGPVARLPLAMRKNCSSCRIVGKRSGSSENEPLIESWCVRVESRMSWKDVSNAASIFEKWSCHTERISAKNVAGPSGPSMHWTGVRPNFLLVRGLIWRSERHISPGLWHTLCSMLSSRDLTLLSQATLSL